MSEEKYRRAMARLASYHDNMVIWSPGRVRAYTRAVNHVRKMFLEMPNN